MNSRCEPRRALRKRPAILTVALVLISFLQAGSGDSASKVQARFASTPQPLAYVLTANAVIPINLTTNTPGTPVPMAGVPLAIAPDGKTAYVRTGIWQGFPGQGAVPGALLPIDIATDTPATPIPVPAQTWPIAVAFTPDGKSGYVITANAPPNSPVFYGNLGDVVPVDLTTNTSRAPILIPAGLAPTAIAIAPDGRTAYVATTNKPGPPGVGLAAVVPINLATQTAGSPIPIPGGDSPFGIAITPDGGTAYVTNDTITQGDQSTLTAAVIPINLATNTPGSPISFSGLVSAIAITPNGQRAYVFNETYSGAGATFVVPINLKTNTLGSPISLSGNALARDIAITADGQTAYLAQGELVVPINLINQTLNSTIQLPAGNSGVRIAIIGATPPSNVSPFTQSCTFESLTDTSGFQGVFFSILGDSHTETSKQWRSDGSGRVVIRHGGGVGLEGVWGFKLSSGFLDGLRADADVSGVFEWDSTKTYEVSLSDVVRLVEALQQNQSINIGPRYLENQVGAVTQAEAGFSAGPLSGNLKIGFQGFGGKTVDLYLGEQTYFGTVQVSTDLSGTLGILGLKTGPELTQTVSVTVDKNQNPIRLTIETAVGTSLGIQLKVAKDADLEKGVAKAEAGDDASVKSIITITAELDLTQPGNVSLSQDFLSSLQDAAVAAVENTVYPGSLGSSPAVPTLASIYQRIMDRSTVTAVQSTQFKNDASAGFIVGDGITFGFTVQNQAVAEQVGTDVPNVTYAVYRRPGGAYTSWDSCLHPKTSP